MEQLYEQKRAAYALGCVKEIKESQSDAVKGKYRTAVRGLGPSVIMNGLGQSLATLYARGERNNGDDGARLLLSHVIQWVGRCALVEIDNARNAQQFFLRVNASPRKTYNLMQVEVVALLEWLSKYAVAMLPNPKDGDGGE